MGGELITIENPKPIPGAVGEGDPGSGSTASRFGLFRKRIARTVDARIVSAAAAGLALGMVVGVATAPRDGSRELGSVLKADISRMREDVVRLTGSVQASVTTSAQIRDQIDGANIASARSETSASDRVDRLEKLLRNGFTEAKADRERWEKEFGASLESLAARLEKPAPGAAVQTPMADAQPATTGAIAGAPAISNLAADWALREVQDGVAMIENRKHEILEVAKGDLVPGLGRVEGVERRGRDWTVMTGKGPIVPQRW
jgi:hypothetical protein